MKPITLAIAVGDYHFFKDDKISIFDQISIFDENFDFSPNLDF